MLAHPPCESASVIFSNPRILLFWCLYLLSPGLPLWILSLLWQKAIQAALAWTRGQGAGLGIGGSTSEQLCDLGENLSSESFPSLLMKELGWILYNILPNYCTMAFPYEFKVSYVSLKRYCWLLSLRFSCVCGKGMGVEREVDKTSGKNET